MTRRRRSQLVKATGQLPAGAVASSDLSGLASALGGGLSVTSSLGPGVPMGPAHSEEQIPRRYDYTPGINVAITPRYGEAYPFETLYGLADSWDVAGIAIGKRIEEFIKIEPTVIPRPIPGQTQKQALYRADSLRDQMSDALGFFETPDQQHIYPSWLSKYLNDLFKGDCGTLYLRGNLGGGLASVEVVDGTTIKPIQDLWGRIAQVPAGTERHQHQWSKDSAPGSFGSAGVGVGMACSVCGSAPAYAQVIKGMIWGWYGSDEIIYQPRSPRAKGPYGHPPAEWIMLSVNRALRRQSLDLAYYTEGTLPAAFLKIPENWTVEQGQALIAIIDQLYAGNDALRSRMIPIPGGPNSGVERVMPEPKNEVEEYLLHIGCAAYAVSPMELGFIRSSGGAGLGGKGIAEEQTDAGRLRQISLASHIRRVYNRVLAAGWSSDLVAYFPSLVEPKDRKLEAETLHYYWMMGAASTDWIAVNVLQTEPPGLGPTVVTASGQVVPIAQIASSELGKPEPPTMAPTPSALPGVNTETPVAKALGGGHLQYKGDLAKIVHRYLLRSYPAKDIEWTLDPAIEWEYEPDVKLDDINYARRPGGRNEDKVDALTDSLSAGASMDPIVLADFGEPKLRIADGYHRTGSAEDAGKDAVPAFIARKVPDKYRSVVMGPMQEDSASVATADLRKWRQKAINAVKRGESAAVPFRSDAIDPATVELVSKALVSARNVADVWALFGGAG
jgi:hypothetical protein